MSYTTVVAILLVLVVILGTIGYAAWRRSQGEALMPKDPLQGDPNRLTTQEQKEYAIEQAETVGDLMRLWSAWEVRGYSREGLLYGKVLEQKKKIQGSLSPTEQEILLEADRKWKHGKNLPPIRGHRGPGTA